MTKMPPAGYPAFHQYLQSGRVSDLERIDRTMSARNVVVARSGRPTCVINQLAPRDRRDPPAASRDLSHRSPDTSASRASQGRTARPLSHTQGGSRSIRTSPAAGGIGTCRYKLKKGQDLDFERVVEVLRAHDIGYFFDIGGNDSQDTAHKLSKLAHERGSTWWPLECPRPSTPSTSCGKTATAGWPRFSTITAGRATARFR